MEISVKHDFFRAGALMDHISREQLPFAASRALNDTARAVRDTIRAELPTIFDRPTPFTQRAVVAPAALAATKERLAAMVTLQPIQAQYLLLEETGGVRTGAMNTRQQSASLVEPGAIKRDQYGNIPAGALRRLKQAAAADKAKRLAARQGKLKRGQRPVGRDSGIVYIAGAARGAHGREGGYFQRTAGGKLVRLTGFARQATYRPRFGFRQRVEQVAAKTFAARLRVRLAEAIG